MKAKELAEELLKTPEFDVKAMYLYANSSGDGICVDEFGVNGIADVGYSDSVTILDLDIAGGN